MDLSTTLVMLFALSQPSVGAGKQSAMYQSMDRAPTMSAVKYVVTSTGGELPVLIYRRHWGTEQLCGLTGLMPQPEPLSSVASLRKQMLSQTEPRAGA